MKLRWSFAHSKCKWYFEAASECSWYAVCVCL